MLAWLYLSWIDLFALANVRERCVLAALNASCSWGKWAVIGTEGTLSFKGFVFPLRNSRVSVCAGQRGLCPHSQEGSRPHSRTWTLKHRRRTKKGESSPGSEGSTHLLVQAKTSDAKPVCQTPAAVVALTPCSHGARTGISQHKLPGGAAYD